MANFGHRGFSQMSRKLLNGKMATTESFMQFSTVWYGETSVELAKF